MFKFYSINIFNCNKSFFYKLKDLVNKLWNKTIAKFISNKLLSILLLYDVLIMPVLF